MVEKIRTCKTIDEAHIIGSNNVGIRNNWNDVREQFYYEGMKAKFTQHPDLAQKLLDTTDKTLVQIDSDYFWGMYIGDNQQVMGQNKGGKILMRVREELRQESM